MSDYLEKDLEERKQTSLPPAIEEGAIAIEESNSAIRRLSRGKALGHDEMTTDWLKDLSEHNRRNLVVLLNKWWQEERLPTAMDYYR